MLAVNPTGVDPLAAVLPSVQRACLSMRIEDAGMTGLPSAAKAARFYAFATEITSIFCA
jgi:hypothetical protein